jgi:hypothetical protein
VSGVWVTTISTGLILAVLGYMMTDLRSIRRDVSNEMDKLRDGLGTKLEELRRDVATIGERVARLEARVDALEHWMQAFAVHEDSVTQMFQAMQRGHAP